MRQYVLRALLLGSLPVLSSGAMARLPDVVEQFLEDRGIGKFSDSITCRKIVSKEGAFYSVFISENEKPDTLYQDPTLQKNLPRTLILDDQGNPIVEGMNKFFSLSSRWDYSAVKSVRASTKADGSNGILAKIKDNLFYVGAKTSGILISNLSDFQANEKLSIEFYKAGSPNTNPVKQEKTLEEWSKEAHQIVQSFVNLEKDSSNKFTEIFPVGTAAIIEHIPEETDAQKLSQLGGKKGINFILLKGLIGDGNLRKYTPDAQLSLLETMGLGNLYLEMSEPVEYRSGEFEKMQQEAIESLDEGKVLYFYDKDGLLVRQEKCKSFFWLVNDLISSPQGLLSVTNQIIIWAGNNREFLSDGNYRNNPAVQDLIAKYKENVLSQVDQIHQFFGNIEGQNPKEITSLDAKRSYVQNLSDGLKKALLDACALKEQETKNRLLKNEDLATIYKNEMGTLDLVKDFALLKEWLKKGYPEFKSSLNPLKNLMQLSDIILTINKFQIDVTEKMIEFFSPGQKGSIDVLLSDNIEYALVEFLKQQNIKSLNNLLDIKRVFKDNCSKLQYHRKLFSVDSITLDRLFELQDTFFPVPNFVLEGKTRPSADELRQAKEARELARQGAVGKTAQDQA
jgi:hypothetical protein